MPKKQKRKKTKKTEKGVVEAVNQLPRGSTKSEQDFAFTQESVADLIVRIATSPIDENYKAMFLYAIARGTFNVDLYDLYIKLLDDHKKKLEKRAKELRSKVDKLQSEYDKNAQELAKAAIGACKEIQAAAEHIEVKTVAQIEKVSEGKAKEEMEAIQKKLKKKKE